MKQYYDSIAEKMYYNTIDNIIELHDYLIGHPEVAVVYEDVFDLDGSEVFRFKDSSSIVFTGLNSAYYCNV